MATMKISGLTAQASPAATDLLEIEQAADGLSRKSTLAQAVAAAPASAGTRGSVKQMPAIASLGLTVSNPPTQAEVQAIADKLDALLAALRTAGILAT